MKAIVDLFVLSYLLGAVPWPSARGGLTRLLLDPVVALARFFGFEQHWGMFAPDPATSDRDLQVILRLPSGAALLWEPPRLHALSRWRAFLWFRYRSYEHAILYDEGGPACRAALAEYLLRKYDFGDTRPRAVSFSYVDREIPPPGSSDPSPPPTRAAFYTHEPSKGRP